ncbi:MAG TPA: ABC transporter permease [Vicinamibacterales bacterium]|nr:ABC transporter permease [Vicinamibacterales bacterium]
MSARELLVRAARAFRLGGEGGREAELSQELRFHLEMLEERHRARGLDPAAARRAARLELGGDAQVAEAWRDQRSLPILETIWQDVRYGVRMLRRTPGFTAAALVTLALGIGANTAIFTIVDAVLLRPLPYPSPDRLMTIGDRNSEGFSSNVGFETVLDWRERSRSFESLAMMRSWLPTLVTNGEAERLPAVRVSWNYFDMMGVRPALGRGFTADDDRPDHWRVLLISDRLWRRRFGADPSVVGRTVTMNDREYRVIGVMPPTFEPLDAARFYNVSAEMWAPIGYQKGGDSSCRSCQHLRGFGRLKAGVTVAQATAEMNVIREQMRREHPSDYEEGTTAVVPLRDALTGGVRTALYVLLGAVAFVLLIACANVANLLLARSVTRQRELALRAVLGAGRARILRQLLTESLLLSAGGAVAGVLVAMVVVRGLATLAPVSLPRFDHIAVDARILAATGLVSIVTGLVFGIVPAWRGAAGGLQRTLSIDSRGSVGGSSRARSVLVVADLVLALVLLAGAGLMLRTVASLTRANPGFDADRILTLQFSLVGQAYAEDPAVVVFQNRTLERIRAVPGVESAALAGQVPFGGNADCWGFHARGRMKPNDVDDPCVERYGTTPDYPRVMGISLRAGRLFTEADSTSARPVILVSESTAKLVWGNDNPIGSDVRIGNATRGPWRVVIGVVADVHHDDLTAPPTPAMYTPQSQLTDSYLVAVVKSSTPDAAALAPPVRAVLRDLDPAIPVYDVATLRSLVARSAAQRLFVMRLLTGFAAVAVLLAAIGLYGVVSYGVAQRTREVGVRVALGAQRRDVLRLVLSSGLSLVAVGVAGGLLVAFVATRYLGTLVFGVSPVDPPTFAGAAALLTLVALAAHWVPIRRALRIDPASALRAE